MRFSRPCLRLPPLCAALALVAGCGGTSSIKPNEVLDESTGMTIGTLDKPIELVQGAAPMGGPERRISFAYLGPVEWDNMGAITYGLWIHVAPGNDWQFEALQEPGAVRLVLADGTAPLAAFQPPALAHAPYRPVASWGETGYFVVDLRMLRRMAASGTIALDVKTTSDAVVRFTAAPDAHDILTRYLHARGYQ
ncbi:MAG TPA: hypothetical protein VHY75_03235 [Steroidobacteraceae bacterium]|jgi:hypothetical protein|nr:hypothetical protein [Steroidobacteraceae bacterium]